MNIVQTAPFSKYKPRGPILTCRLHLQVSQRSAQHTNPIAKNNYQTHDSHMLGRTITLAIGNIQEAIARRYLPSDE